jgi:hypothetical protein
MPQFPVIIVRGDALFSADTPQTLVNLVAMEIQDVADQRIVLIAATGEEFMYFDDSKSLMPTMMRKRRTKKEFIELFNSSINARKTNASYSEKSLSAKTYQRIFNDIVDLILKNHP